MYQSDINQTTLNKILVNMSSVYFNLKDIYQKANAFKETNTNNIKYSNIL